MSLFLIHQLLPSPTKHHFQWDALAVQSPSGVNLVLFQPFLVAPVSSRSIAERIIIKTSLSPLSGALPQLRATQKLLAARMTVLGEKLSPLCCVMGCTYRGISTSIAMQKIFKGICILWPYATTWLPEKPRRAPKHNISQRVTVRAVITWY